MGLKKVKSHIVGLIAAGILITLIFSILIPPAMSINLSIEAPEPTYSVGDRTFTFSNVNITISGVETIPMTSINFTIFLGTTEIDHVRFHVNGIEYEDPADRFETRLVSPSQDALDNLFIPSVGYGYGYGYVTDTVYDDIIFTYQINYTTNAPKGSTDYRAKFFVDTSSDTYASDFSDIFTVKKGTPVSDTNKPPIADAGGPYNAGMNQMITLDGSESDDPDGTIDSYNWDLDNDGQFDDATGIAPTKSWSTSGTYPISLMVTDNEGATDTDSSTVTVTGYAPVAKIDGPYYGNPGKVIKMNASESYDTDGTIVKYNWTFGDFTTGSGQIVNHAYPTVGNYTITLTVTDNEGLTDTETTTARIIACGVLEVNETSPNNKYNLKGYLLDENCNGVYEFYFNSTSGKKTLTGNDGKNASDIKKYFIDDDADGIADYNIHMKNGKVDDITPHQGGGPGIGDGTAGFPIWLAIVGIIVAIVIIIIVLFKKGFIYLE